jgi:hypothetical protein
MRRRTAFVFATMTVVLTVLAAACGGASSKTSTSTSSAAGGVDPNAPEVVAPGDIPDTQAFVPFIVATDGYSLKVPEGWARSTNGSTTTFTDHYNTINATATSAPVAPTAASVQATEVTALRRDVPNFELLKVETVNRTAGPAVLVTYRAGSTPDPVTGKRVALDVERYEFWRSGKQVTLTLSGARGSDNVDPWKTVTNSFAWTA